MHAEVDGYILIYEEIQGGVRLLRVYGDSPKITLPCSISEKSGQIIEIGAYCFASKAKVSTEIKEELIELALGDGEKPCDNGLIRPICGEYPQEIELPESVISIGDFCFYGCRALRKISIGVNVSAVGSDVFMNCKSLHSLIIRADVKKQTVLQKILALINTEIEVSFTTIEGDETNQIEKGSNELVIKNEVCIAKVLYPMFTESYELLGPAHIFGLNLEGEGYRARKQFKDDIIDLAGYDQIFYKARNEERFETLVKMAVDRLMYPVDLSEEAKEVYEKYISDNEGRLMKTLVERGAEKEIMDVLQTGLISPLGKKAAIEAAIAEGKTLLVSKICRI